MFVHLKGDEPMIGPLLGPMEAPFPEDEQFTRGRGALNAKATGRREYGCIIHYVGHLDFV